MEGVSRPVKIREAGLFCLLIALFLSSCTLEQIQFPPPANTKKPPRSQRPPQPPGKPVKIAPAGEYVLHRVRPGEILSKIAMKYYGTYLTGVYWDPSSRSFIAETETKKRGGKIGIVTDAIVKANGISADNLRAGQEIKLPEIEGLPFQTGTPTAATPPPEKEEKRSKQPEPARGTAAEQKKTPATTAERGEPDRSRRHLDQGIEAFELRDYTDAARQLRRAVALKPDDEVARDYLSRALYQKGMEAYYRKDYLSAIDAFKSALTHAPDCGNCKKYLTESESIYKDTHYKQGIEYFQKEQLEEAIEEWEKVVKLDSDYESVQKNIETARRLMDRLEEMEPGGKK